MPDDLDIGSYEPSFLEDGLGVSGQQTDYTEEDVQDWDLNAWTDQSQSTEDFTGTGGGACMSDAGDPPDTGTWVLGSIDGTCQWIETCDAACGATV